MDASQQYCLRWNNHRTNLLSVFDELLHNEAFTDVTIAAEGGTIKCHKVVLVACSPYFQSLFSDLQCSHPIVVLKDVKLSEIKAILEYMYRGEVNVAQDQLGSLLKIAEVLKVKGLVEENAGGSQAREEAVTTMSPPPAISTSTGGAPHNAHSSPPHSTDSSYSGFYSVKSIERSQGRLGTMTWPGIPIFSASNTYPLHLAGHESSTGGDIGFKSMPLTKRKRNDVTPIHQAACSLSTNRDTPILRTVLRQGQAHVDSSHVDNHHEGSQFCTNNTSSTSEDKHGIADLIHAETAHSPYVDAPAMEEDEKQRISPQSYAGDSKSNIVNFTQQRPEWKRYKQYSREDIMRAIEAVKSGISPVQAARTHGVPSRTLYDKVKKLGISTPRPFKRAPNGSSTCYSYGIGGNAKGSIYSGSLTEIDNESRDINSAGTQETSFETAKVKDASQDLGDSATPLDTAVPRCTPSPVIRCVKQELKVEDEVEDLSVNRKSDVPVIMPPTTSGVANEESQDVAISNDRQDYN
ncbi:PREDICTED: broad-complex core protein isoforms 1/2/3/4/5-like [Dinoponera quadriceps]|uniref:Broad-complex core protein isoforms 1/2/3/4/5-like n=1 Tax=Dinoponera quadriceps TaxID=609295 RepID=A0A6P3XM65_DINQU|nr:PREDICTED: broad-complex core protein isoforms 1/2/3/4/5-like [Dinoponera quadriceps]